ncbi:MAG TPA: TrkA family potassium uptake protein [Mycobacteriales bacterium]
MHVVILGCGRVGSAVARRLDARGHSVAVIDQNEDAFARLGEDFGGRTVAGIGFDRDTLIEAGIEQAGAFAAVSSGDNSNIIAARVARETFGIENVVARIYDPRRAEVYTRLGIPTVATVRWTAEQMVRQILPDPVEEWSDPSGTVTVARVPFAPGWIGHGISQVEAAGKVRVVSITRFGAAMLPHQKTVLQDDDVLYLAVEHARVAEITALLQQAPEEVR